MTTNFHTPWIDKPASGFTTFTAASMNPALGELDAVLTWLLTPKTVTSGAAITIAWADAAVQFLDLGHDATFTFSGGVAGRKYVLAVKGNGYTPVWPGTIRYGDDLTSILLSAGATWTYLGFIYNGVDAKYELVSVVKGF